MPKLDVTEIAVQNTAWNAGARAVSGVAGVATSILLARTLGREQMGAYTYALWIAGVAASLSGLGIPQTVGRYVGEYVGREELGNAAFIARKLSLLQLLLGVAVAAALVPIAFRFTGLADHRALALAALLVIPLGLQPVLLSALAGTQRYVYVGTVTAAGSLVQLSGVAIASLFHAGMVSMLASVLAGLLVSTGLALLFCRWVMPVPGAIERATANRIFTPARKFAWTISYLVLLDLIIWDQVELLFLKHYAGLAEVAFFGIACSMAGRLHSLGAIFTDLMMPLSAYAYGREGKAGR